MTAARDPQRAAGHDDERLRRFLAARRAGDATGARRWWEELLTFNFDRINGMVVLESRGRLSHDEQQDALQRALLRMATNLIDTFRGHSMGEWVQATRRLVTFACIDTQRRAVVVSKHERRLEGAGDDPDRADAELHAAIERLRREAEDRDEDAAAVREGRAFLDWAVPRLSPRLRAVIELDLEDLPVEEIQARLGVSRDVVYAARSRALKELAKLRDEWPG